MSEDNIKISLVHKIFCIFVKDTIIPKNYESDL